MGGGGLDKGEEGVALFMPDRPKKDFREGFVPISKVLCKDW